MGSFALAPAAYSDLEDIDAYTLEAWGPAKRDVYIRGLFEVFEQLAAFPGLGMPRPDVAPQVRATVYQKQHLVFYEVFDKRCFILRILHHSRDVAPVLVTGRDRDW
jgi:toxin ParE1/3/4